MSDSSWLAFGGLAASTLSALAAYLAIQQTIKQRRISNKVQLILKNNTFEVHTKDISTPIPLNNANEQFDINLSILNVGLGPAIKLEYEWDFDYEKILSSINVSKFDTVNSLDAEKYRNAVNASTYCYSFEKDNEHIRVGLYGCGSFRPYTQKLIYNDTNYILSCGIEKKETELYIPKLIIILLTQSIMKSNNGEDIFAPTSGPTLIIRYEDVTGVKEEKIYKSYIRLDRISGGSTFPHQNLRFCLSYSHPYTWTSLALEKIRKWYAECKKTILLNNNN
ncbi:hypothetical protein MUU49_07415 [Scandinavium goeteborgense]|uniref:hypothetical protein n=1 Tax=Scandinavium goeteborgense TaxID=1851514 RepID=UPI002165D899|nr:hypothetical protein [Scandinavium goeteborgense]MCS2152407.1 hypothetical protein [Scandinavium goeteborgense]